MNENQVKENLKYLKLLSKQFPTVAKASTEIINLEAILNLPKGTEHFLSDIHGEDEAFAHILKSGSGVVKSKVDLIFSNSLTVIERKKLAILIYYPRQVINSIEKDKSIKEEEKRDWYIVNIHRLIQILREISSKYSHSKVRKALPEDFAYIIEELMYERENDDDKNTYYKQILNSIYNVRRAKSFIIELSQVISILAVDHLHLIGDIYDRGPNPDKIVDRLMASPSCDIQWGNHDVLWIGAAAGSIPCILTAIRISVRYGNLSLLEDSYGINLFPLIKYALDNVNEVEETFYPKNSEHMLEEERFMLAQINKITTILLLKYESLLVKRNPSYDLLDRALIDRVDFENKEIKIGNKLYKLDAIDFPCVNTADPSMPSKEEVQILTKVRASFLNNPKLQKHAAFLVEKGSMYTVYNGNLLYHGCIPLDEDGNYAKVKIYGKDYEGRALLDKYEKLLRIAFAKRHEHVDEKESDIFWYLWSGKFSSLFGKEATKTFERTYIKEKETHAEVKNPYYKFIQDKETCLRILTDFGASPERGRIINGHVPVKVKKGESPIKADGKLLVIDGGISKAYQSVTGIAGYTLIYNSHGMLLAEHEPFTSAYDSYTNFTEMLSSLTIVEESKRRILVSDTDNGKIIQGKIDDLKMLLFAYRQGLIKTSFSD